VKGRLNLFQRTMLRWRELHPYNAVHVLRISAPLDPERLSRSIADVLAGQGLTGLVLDPEGGRYEYRGGPAAVAVEILPAGGGPAAIEAAIERGLNATFPERGPLDPFRFFALDGGSHFHLGLAYDHFIAGGDSIVVLMKDLHDAYLGGGEPRHPELYPPAYGPLFLRRLGPLVTGLPGLVEMIRSCRNTARPSYRDGVPPTNAFRSFRLDATALATILWTSRAWGVTLNDLLLAQLLLAMAPEAGARSHGRRRMMAVASIVNIRAEYQPPATQTFGQFLSSFRVTHPMPRDLGVKALAQDVRAATARTKRRRLWLQTLIGIAGSSLVWQRLSPEYRARFHAKNYPVWGGVTLVNVDAQWREAGGGDPPEYIRGVPTGPMAPLVVAASTTQGGLQLGFSWRIAAFDHDTVDNIAARILAGLTSLAP
jgi:hypothetical protein